MTPEDADLSVRQHLRYTCSLPVEIAVAPASAEAVRLTKASAGGSITGQLTDFSLGGLGLHLGIFLPVACRLTMVLDQPGVPSLHTTVRVRRVAMVDRSPTYYIGTAFEHATPDEEADVSRFLDWLKTGAAERHGENLSAQP